MASVTRLEAKYRKLGMNHVVSGKEKKAEARE